MTKYITIPSKDNLNDCLKYSDGIIVGIIDLSVNMPEYFSVSDIINFDGKNKDIFVALNKNMHNKDLKLLKEVMISLESSNIKGVIFYDLSVLNLHKKLNLNYELVWGKEHATTNYLTANYFYDKNVLYMLASADMTMEETIEVNENTNTKLLVPIFGYLPMFVSPRHLVENYKKEFSLVDNSKINYMHKEEKDYPIIDDVNGSLVYSSNILEGLSESLLMKEKQIAYLVLNSFMIEDFITILKMYKDVTRETKDIYESKIKEMLLNTDKGFLYKETVYKVKKNG